MPDDHQMIRDVIATWMRASAAGDLTTVLSLMTEDVVFLVAGQPPMRGKEAFAAGFKGSTGRFRIDAASEIQEIQVANDMAYCWTHLRVTMTPLQGGEPKHRSGYTLSIFRKSPEGKWLLSRDANLLT